MLNIGLVNTFILYMAFRSSPIMTHFDCINALGYELMATPSEEIGYTKSSSGFEGKFNENLGR